MPGINETPEVVLGLEVDGQSFQRANTLLDRHAVGWEKIEGHVARIGGHIDGILGRVAGLAGVAGVGMLANDFLKLEDAAARASLAVGSVTGSTSGYRPLRDAVRAAAIANYSDPVQLLQAIGNLQGAVGGNYLASPGNAGRVSGALGGFATAFGLDPRTLASQVGAIEANSGVGTGATGLVLARLAGQAQGAGMGAQTGLFTQTVSGVTAALGQSAPGQVSPLTPMTVGALYGTAVSQNNVFRDPAVFGQAVQGVQGAVQGAYGNPRLQAIMQMAGIGYWEQRGGFNGPHGRELAQKLLAWSSHEYGAGSEEQDLFLRSNFGGTVSADFLKAVGRGGGTFRHLLAPNDASALDNEHRRIQQYGSNPSAALQQKRNQAGRDTSGIFGGAFDFLSGLPWEVTAAAGAGGLVGAGKLGKFGWSKLIKGPRDAARAAALAEDAATAARGPEAVLQAAERVAAAHAAEHAAARVGARAAGHLVPGLDALMFGMDAYQLFTQVGTHNFPTKGPAAGRHLKQLYDQGRIGPGSGNLSLHRAVPQADPRLQGYPDGGATTAPGRPHSVDRFDSATRRFERSVDKIGRGGSGNASFGLDAAGTSGVSDQIGSSMLFAKYLLGGGSSGGGHGHTFASIALGGGGGGGGGSFSTAGVRGGPAAFRRAAVAAGHKYGIDPALLMGIADVETGGTYKTNLVSSAGAEGPMQFMPQTWRAYGHGDVHNVNDAMEAAARYLKASGGMKHLYAAIYAYNHSSSYVAEVERRMARHRAHARHHASGQNAAFRRPSADHAWLMGGAPTGMSGNGHGDIIINVDGRTVERHKLLTRGAI